MTNKKERFTEVDPTLRSVITIDRPDVMNNGVGEIVPNDPQESATQEYMDKLISLILIRLIDKYSIRNHNKLKGIIKDYLKLLVEKDSFPGFTDLFISPASGVIYVIITYSQGYRLDMLWTLSSTKPASMLSYILSDVGREQMNKDIDEIIHNKYQENK